MTACETEGRDAHEGRFGSLVHMSHKIVIMGALPSQLK